MKRYTYSFRRLLTHTTVPALGLAACLFLSFGCGDLAGILGNAEPVSCTITGKIVGVDGGQPAKVDIQWIPDAELTQSFELFKANVNDDGTFTVTELVSEQGNSRVQGELRFGEEAIPPLPLQYEQAVVDIDLPVGACTQDLGDVALPLLGTGNSSNGTSNGTTGTSNGTTGTSNGTTGTSNGT